MDYYNMCSNVDPGIEDRSGGFEEVNREPGRIELHNTVESRHGSFSNKESTYCISNRLDRLIVQFLKIQGAGRVDKGQDHDQ